MICSTGKPFSATSFSPTMPRSATPIETGLRDVVVAQVEDFQRKPFRAGDEFALALGNADACFGKQVDALFVQSALGLDGYS